MLCNVRCFDSFDKEVLIKYDDFYFDPFFHNQIK